MLNLNVWFHVIDAKSPQPVTPIDRKAIESAKTMKNGMPIIALCGVWLL